MKEQKCYDNYLRVGFNKMIDSFINPMTKEEYRNWTMCVAKHNHENPDDQVSYEVNWKDDVYRVKLLDLKVDNEG
jgi:hypothetical protein